MRSRRSLAFIRRSLRAPGTCSRSGACARRGGTLRARVFSSTPGVSYMTRPGWMSAAHSSTPPLPPPMRTSSGFFVTGRSGKTRIQSLPARFTWRVIAIRAASIWRDVRRPGSTACMAKSPKDDVAARGRRCRGCCPSASCGTWFASGKACCSELLPGSAGGGCGAGRTSPLKIQTLTPMMPYLVRASAGPNSMSARSVWSGTRPSR